MKAFEFQWHMGLCKNGTIMNKKEWHPGSSCTPVVQRNDSSAANQSMAQEAASERESGLNRIVDPANLANTEGQR